jgi:hypothetical protein
MQTQSPPVKPASSSSGLSTSNINTDVYIADGDYIKDIEVNDLRNRYTLTKGSTQKMVNILAYLLIIPGHVPRLSANLAFQSPCNGLEGVQRLPT